MLPLQKSKRHAAVLQTLRGKSSTRRDAHAAADNRVRAQIARSRIGNVHGTAFAAAVTRFLSQQFGEHAIGRSALGQTVAVASMSAGDVVVKTQSLANTNGNRLFAAVEMSQAGHQGASVEFVDLLFNRRMRTIWL